MLATMTTNAKGADAMSGTPMVDKEMDRYSEDGIADLARLARALEAHCERVMAAGNMRQISLLQQRYEAFKREQLK